MLTVEVILIQPYFVDCYVPSVPIILGPWLPCPIQNFITFFVESPPLFKAVLTMLVSPAYLGEPCLSAASIDPQKGTCGHRNQNPAAETSCTITYL